METRQSVRWVHESGPIGRLERAPFMVCAAAVVGVFCGFLMIEWCMHWSGNVRPVRVIVVMALTLAGLCWWRLRREHYVRLEACVGPEGIQAEWTRYAKPASEVDRGPMRLVRHGVAAWERVRSVLVRWDQCGTKVRCWMQVQYRLRGGGGGMSMSLPDVQTAEQVVEVLKDHLPASAVRVRRTILPTARQGWWLLGLSLGWMAVVIHILEEWGYRPDMDSPWTLVIWLGCGPGIPWALAVSKRRIWRSPVAIGGLIMSNLWANLFAGVIWKMAHVMAQLR